jgi:FkbM family methyltransferase
MNRVKRCRYGDMVFQTNDTYVGRSFDLYGEFSEAEVVLFRQLVKPGQVILDIGANIGAHTVPLAQLTGPGGRVLAFEPQRTPFYSLCANVVLNNLTNVVCHQAAAGEAAGSLSVPELDYWAENNFGGLELARDYSHHRTYTVPILKVDDLDLADCHFMKIDVEGMEQKVLAGAVETIRRYRPLLYVEDDRYEKSAELRAFLAGLGYELYVHQPPLYNPQNLFNNPQNVFGKIISLNLYCYPRDAVSPINPEDFRMVRVQPESEATSDVNPLPGRQSSEEAVLYNRQAINMAMHGRLEQAVAHFEQALQLNPDYGEAHNNLGNVFYFQGRFDAAVACYEQALRLEPNFAVAHNNLGTVLSCLGRYEEAAAHCRQALALRPDYPEAHSNLAIALQGRGNAGEAIFHYEEAVRLKPDYAEAHHNLGLSLAGRGQFAEAVASYQEALRLKPDYAEAHANLSSALIKLDKWEEAMDCCRQALRLKPDSAEVHYALGVALAAQGKYEEALHSYEQARLYRPDYADANFACGVTWLLLGNFERGWPGYEWRAHCQPDLPRWSFRQPRWDSTPLGGRPILLYVEQGLGDTLQFIRYVPLVRERGGRVTVCCPPEAVPLLASCQGIEQLLTEVPSDWPATYASLLSLPGIFGTTLATIPANVPYLAVDLPRVERWHQQLDSLSARGRKDNESRSLNIGIAWQGNPKHKQDRQRSLPLTRFESLARLPGVQLFSLQVGPGAEQLADLGDRFPITDLGSRFDATSLLDVAAAVKALDLVISVDSAMGHLAGALGIPVWVLLPYVPDWRWLLEREDSPWYPTMRLFRQKGLGDWDGVFERLVAALTGELLSTFIQPADLAK